MPDINAVLLGCMLNIAHRNNSDGTCSIRDWGNAGRNSRRHPGARLRRGNINRTRRPQDAPDAFGPLPLRRDESSSGRSPDRKQAQSYLLPDVSPGIAVQTSPLGMARADSLMYHVVDGSAQARLRIHLRTGRHGLPLELWTLISYTRSSKSFA